MLVKKYVLFFSCILLCCISCRNAKSVPKESTVSLENEIIELPQGFDAFYEKFHKDSTFQIQRIVFPLENNSTNTEIGEFWTKENWITHHAYDDHGGTFQRGFRAIGTLVIETIVEAKGLFYMERRYAKLADGWHMIYYEVSLPTFNN